MLMAALMGGLPEIVVWNLVGEGAKKGHANPWIRFLAFCPRALKEALPESGDKDGWTARNQKVAKIWKDLSKDQKTVFRDPYFFALAGLPDLSNVQFEGDGEVLDPEDGDVNTSLQHLDDSTVAPPVHKLSSEDRLKYQPIFEELVDAAKLHLCYGKPAPSSSVATLQKKSIVELRKAHHAFAVVCQRYQITYYLAAVSCGSTEGWNQVYSNDTSFANWASKDAKVPDSLRSYIHGKSAVKIVEGCKVQQPSDERKTCLGRELNKLLDAFQKGETFPKHDDPVDEIKMKGWPIRIVQKEGSLLLKEDLHAGHCLAKSATVKNWLKDIEEKQFLIEQIPESELLNRQSQSHKSRKKRRAKKPNQVSTQHSTSNHDTPRHNSGNHSDGNEDPQMTQGSNLKSSNLKRKLQELAKGDGAQRKKNREQSPSPSEDSESDSDTLPDCNSDD
ncbi:uncharacterized protein MELLADRAFT_91371 [Melampsora larici-populina 98AG31]|uniref:Uncharacterized protein n=1 Tax=Melampsora larici-populina (strain 98AG31 / pathotype 3-4-7) TaxID=747676 RepID=F4RYT6_MELLP|nr:uncharacterized protein MELLADRAFT_91371 [Melampsora larici-populina 98AG31]EGG02447.1 hypothetical protein MELLADRAFT_91371 [Melampsora larici-populina 98AG31]